MANTGNAIVYTLRLFNLTTDEWMDTYKPNLPGDPDYVPMDENLDECPIDYSTVCPVPAFGMTGVDSIGYEFSLTPGVLRNPALSKVQVSIRLVSDDSLVDFHEYTDFSVDYFSGTFSGLDPDNYYLDIEYLDESNALITACTELASVELDPDITWEGIDPFCVTVPSCDTGDYDEDSNSCIVVDTVAATAPSVGSANAAAISNVQWNNGGAQVFASGYSSNGSGTVAATLITPHFWVNGNFQWDTVGRNTTDSRMNAAGIWVTGETSNPLNEWIGFSRTITTPTTKTYYVAIAADNKFRVAVDGTTIIDCPGTVNGIQNFAYLNIYPVTLTAGIHIIEMWGLNTGSAAGMVMEIYDMTYAALIAADDVSDLNILFSTQDVAGNPFHLGDTIGWSCPAGYSLDYNGGSPICKDITSITPAFLRTGMKGFENRIRLLNGVPDGFEEPNIDGEGIGTYVVPVEDETTCPPEVS